MSDTHNTHVRRFQTLQIMYDQSKASENSIELGDYGLRIEYDPVTKNVRLTQADRIIARWTPESFAELLQWGREMGFDGFGLNTNPTPVDGQIPPSVNRAHGLVATRAYGDTLWTLRSERGDAVVGTIRPRDRVGWIITEHGSRDTKDVVAKELEVALKIAADWLLDGESRPWNAES